MSLNKLKKLIKEGIEDFVSQQQRETISFEDNPLEFILQKYSSLDATLNDLMTDKYRDYITGVYVVAPKPTTFKILLHNGQEFYLIYGPQAYIAKISGKKYNLMNLKEEEFAITSLAALLELGMPPGSEGPEEQTENETDLLGDEGSEGGDTPTEEPEDDEEELQESEEITPTKPLKFRIIKENLTKKTLKFRIVKENSTKKPFSSLSQRAQEVGKELMKLLSINEEDILYSTLNRLILLSDQPRSKIFQQLTDLGYIRDFSIPGSSQGGFKTEDNIQIIVKPKSGQGLQSAGKQNEVDFNSLIDTHIQKNNGDPITITFKGNGKVLTYKDVAKALDASTSGATEFDKSDTDLLDISGNLIVGISLKKRNAVRWESSKRRPIGDVNIFKSFIEKVGKIGSDDEIGKFENVILTPLEQKGKYKLTNPETNQVLSKVIIKNTPPSVIENVVFGDTDNKTIVIKETFEGGFSNFSYDEDKSLLTINCYKIYTEVSDLMGTDDEPVFAFSNHIGQAFGIEFRSFSKGLLYKDNELRGSSTEIDFNELK